MTSRDRLPRDKRRLEWAIVEVVPGECFVRVFGWTKAGTPVEVEFPCGRDELAGWVEDFARAHRIQADREQNSINQTRARIRDACGGGS